MITSYDGLICARILSSRSPGMHMLSTVHLMESADHNFTGRLDDAMMPILQWWDHRASAASGDLGGQDQALIKGKFFPRPHIGSVNWVVFSRITSLKSIFCFSSHNVFWLYFDGRLIAAEQVRPWILILENILKKLPFQRTPSPLFRSSLLEIIVSPLYICE